MDKISKKKLASCSKEELITYLSKIDQMDINNRLMFIEELEKREETQLIEEINERLNSQSTAPLPEAQHATILKHYYKLFDEKIELNERYQILAKTYNVEIFEIQKIVSQEVKKGKQAFYSGVILSIIGALRLFTTLSSYSHSKEISLMVALCLIGGGMYLISSSSKKRQLA